MPQRRLIAPVAEPITLNEAKAQLRFTSNAEDALISALIGAARDLCESETGRALMPQTWESARTCFLDKMYLNRAPVTSITSIKYIDVDGNEQTLANTGYVLDNASDSFARVVIAPNKSWPAVLPSIYAVRIRYVAGYADANAVPQALKQWMLLQISHWFRNRESVNVGNIVSKVDYVDSLLNAYRIYGL